MTVPTTTSSVAYTSTGVTATYNYTWQIASQADLIVYTTNVAGTVITRLALTTDYTVTGVGVFTGGTITLTAGIPTSGTKVFIASDPSQIQELLLSQGQAFNPSDIMAALDLLTREVQANRRLINGAVRFPVSESLGGLTSELPSAVNRASQTLITDALGNITTGEAPASGVISSAMAPVVAAANLATARDLLGVNGALVINAKDAPYLAVGDGTTDDTAAIQAAIDAAELVGAAVYLPPGVYRTTASLLIDVACSLISDSKPGPRIYNSAGPYGGAEIRADWSVASNVAPSAFALQIDVGSIGAEGYANTLVHGIGFVHTDADGGGIYVEGSVGVEIYQCRFTGDLNQWLAGTANGIGIWARDMIVSHVHDCQFFRIGWGLLADDVFNENGIEHNDFFNVYNLPIGIWAASSNSTRNTIRRNNFTGDPGGVQNTSAIRIGGLAFSTVISQNTFEAIRLNTIFIDGNNPLTGAPLGVYPKAVSITENEFIACCGGQVGGVNVSVAANVVHVVATANSLFNPTGNNAALVGIAAGAAYVYAYANYVGSKVPASGNTDLIVIDEQLYRSLPRDTSESTKSGWTSDNSAALWQSTSAIRCWQGTRAADLAQQGSRIDSSGDATPSAIGINLLFCNLGSDYNITAIDDGRAGQVLTIYNSAAGFSPTLVQSASLLLSGSANKILAHAGGRIVMQCIGGNVWAQIDTMISP